MRVMRFFAPSLLPALFAAADPRPAANGRARCRTRPSAGAFVLISEAKPDAADGYGWHLNEIRAGGRVYRGYEANGNGGQLLMVLPELDVAVVVTAGNYGTYGVWRKFRDEWLPEHIIPAISGR